MPAKVRLPSDDELRWITRRAVAEIIPEAEFVEALRAGRRLRLKMGFDPTRPVITLGWAVGLRKLRQLQELGHQVVLIIGDWTAQIGDPSGESQTRPMLGADEVKANAEAVLRQFYRVLDEKRTEVRWQSEWFGPPDGPSGFTLADVVRLAARFTVAQMLQRDDFAQRYRAGKAIAIQELIYPLLQAYDSIAVGADVEFGGTDQKFNILVGRELQASLGQFGPSGRPQAAFLVPLLVGLDGKQKMSQSLANYIAIDAPPHDMYGKLMSIPDSLMLDYFELLTDVPEEELDGIKGYLQLRAVNPMEIKMRLAFEIVSQFHGRQAAEDAQSNFVRVFREKDVPASVPEFALSFTKQYRIESAAGWGDRDEIVFPVMHYLPKILADSGIVPSVSEARRLIDQGAVDRIIGGSVEKVTRDTVQLIDGIVFHVGKHRFLRIVDADKRPQTDNG